MTAKTKVLPPMSIEKHKGKFVVSSKDKQYGSYRVERMAEYRVAQIANSRKPQKKFKRKRGG